MTDGITMVPTNQIGEILYIPTEGLLQVFQYDIDPVSLLNAPGRYGCLHVGTKIQVHFRINESAEPNDRASEALNLLANFFMVLTGPVVLTGIPGEHVYQIIQRLSQEGTQ